MAPESDPAHDLNCLTISELEQIALTRMDKQTRDYYNEGADRGSTLAENISAYAKYRIRPRVLRDISHIDTSVRLPFKDGDGQHELRNAIPLGVAPTAMQALAHPDGEAATARACRRAGVVMGLSSFSTTTLEEVARQSGDNPRVLQLYLFEEREHSRRLIRRARDAGYKAVFLTVDTPMLGRRNLEIRNQFALPKHLKVANFNLEEEREKDGKVEEHREKEKEREDRTAELEQEKKEYKAADANQSKKRSPSPSSEASKQSEAKAKAKARSKAGHHDGTKRVAPTGPITFHTHAANPTLTWESDIAWLKRECGPSMQVWVKGIATGEDALLALRHGCDGIVVSNHGGRQLDGALATLDALPDVVAAVRAYSADHHPRKRPIPIHVDGGIRHGTDIFKALALGADFCWVGRPVLWGLAYKGEEGVALALRLLGDELRLCMGLAGVCRVEDITKDYLVKVDRSGFVSRL